MSEQKFKTTEFDSVSSFSGLRKFQATRIAKVIFGEEAFFKIELDHERRKFLIYIKKNDKTPKQNQEKEKFEKHYKQCEIFFITISQKA